MSITGTVYNIQQFSVHDGPGIRTTVFLKGCPLTCWWCHNPESRSPEIIKMNGKSIGKKYTVSELIGILRKDVIFYDQSNGGVTFSGGEPLEQLEFLAEVLKQCRQAGIHTAVDTSGYAVREAFARIIPYTSLILYDLKLMDRTEHINYTSVSNELILSNLEFLLTEKCNVIIRIPLIPGITNTDSNIHGISKFLQRFSPLPEVNILPYHRTAEGKYNKLCMINKLKGIRELTPEEINHTLEIIASSGLPVKLG